MDWFRWWHGTVTDPKFQWVARKSGQSVGSVIAVWAALLECASTATQGNADATRGNVASFDCNDFDVALGFDDGVVQSIFHAMEQKGLISDRCISKWNERQPKREDSGNPNTGALSSTERSRIRREKLKRDGTQCNDVQRNATLGNDREEESREEVKEENTMSGLPDSAQAVEVLDYLNATAGKAYRKVETNLKLIRAKLASGATVDECKAVIDAKVQEWGEKPEMEQYLRPETLFGARKFEQYLGQLKAGFRGSAVPPGLQVPEGATYIPGKGVVW